MNILTRRFTTALACASLLGLASAPQAVLAADTSVKIRVQSVIPATQDENIMFKDFARDVSALTDGTVTFEVLPAGAIVAMADTLSAVDKGLIEGGFAWTHYW